MTSEEKLSFIEAIEERERILDQGERQAIDLAIKNIDHKRAFLGTLMTISVAVIAGLFVLISQDNGCLNLLVTINCIFFVSFLLASTIYLTIILSRESISLNKNLEFIRESKRDFIRSLTDGTIKNLDGYEEYRKKKYKREKELRKNIKNLSEIWFILINVLFVFSIILLFITLLFIIFKQPCLK